LQKFEEFGDRDSVINKDLTCKVKAKTKDQTGKVKVKYLSLKAKATRETIHTHKINPRTLL